MPTTNTDTPTPAADGADAGASPSAVRRFGRVPVRWLEDPGVGVEELAVLTALAVHADRDGVCVVRQRTLAGLLQHSREWVCRVLARLCQPGGLVEKEHRADRDGWNLACRYRLPDLAGPSDTPTDLSGDPMPGSRTSGRDGTRLEDAGNPAGDSAPAGPVMPAPVEPAVPAPEAVITPAIAGVTDGAHQEQTPLNKDSSSGATLRCAGCHCRERSMGGNDRNGGDDRNRPVPADWWPDAGDVAWLAAHRPDLDAGHMTAVFVCGARARGLRYADPSAAWRRWALAERASSRRPTATCEPPRDFRDAPRPMPSARSAHHAAQEARNAAIGREVLASMMARRGMDAGAEG
jgi:hypothetical protein